MFVVFFFYSSSLILFHHVSSQSVITSKDNTFVFSSGVNTYIAFESWRPCLTGSVSFEIRTTIDDGTVAYIDDRGKFDFFYLKILQGKLRLLFNLGNDRQALNVNMNINDDQWHRILIERNGKLTRLTIDDQQKSSSILTHSEDLYFGGATYEEYEASPFYFGGIPSILERPSSGNLSSFDVYMQPRFRGQLRNLIYQNCTDRHFLQPSAIQLSGSVSLIPNHACQGNPCDPSLCLITEKNFRCHCSDEQDDKCIKNRTDHHHRTMTFLGKQSAVFRLNNSIRTMTELLTFRLKTNRYDGLIFQLIPDRYLIKIKSGQLMIDYRWNHSWIEYPTKDLSLIDDQWHYIQIHRQIGSFTLLIDQEYFLFENEQLSLYPSFITLNEIRLGSDDQHHEANFYGCLKDISILFNENRTILIHPSSSNYHSFGYHQQLTCQELLQPIQFLTSSSYLTIPLKDFTPRLSTVFFRFQTSITNGILFYIVSSSVAQSEFFGLDLIDGFLSLTINFNKKKQREELFQQRFNDGQMHSMQCDLIYEQYQTIINITLNHRQNTRLTIRHNGGKFQFHTLTIGGLNPSDRWIPSNYWSGIMHHGFIGCFADLELNHRSINLTTHINTSNTHIAVKTGPCILEITTKKRPCLCEHQGECRYDPRGQWFCDCSKTAYTGQRCEQLAYHLSLNEINTIEFNTDLLWSDQIDDVTFRFRAKRDEENFFEIRSCRLASSCDRMSFSIRNGLIHIDFYRRNLTSSTPFVLDQQWHSVHLKRLNRNLILHVDHQIVQETIDIEENNTLSLYPLWIVFHGDKNIFIEDLRIYDQLIYRKWIEKKYEEKIQWKSRSWKPLNSISFDHHEKSFLEIPFNDFLCQDCPFATLDFRFRTKESQGLLLFAPIQIPSKKQLVSRYHQYLLLQLVHGKVHLIISDSSLPRADHRLYQIQSERLFDDGHWHQISLFIASDHHLEISIDMERYSLVISFRLLDRIYFGRPSDIFLFDPIRTLPACLASLTINGQHANLHEYIPSNAQLRNDCFLDSQCPLTTCQNTGRCRDRIECQCEHTSFQGRFCTEFRLGYAFSNITSGLIFDQPWTKDRTFQNYRLSFGLITRSNYGEIIRINDHLQIELIRGSIRMKYFNQEIIRHDRLVNDSRYHLIQIEYHQTRLLSLIVDNKPIVKQLNQSLPFDKPLILLIGQNPAFKQSFQGQLFGLESDMYSIFDLISPTFHRLSYASIRNRSLTTSPPSILYPLTRLSDDTSLSSSCSYQSYDDICIIQLETNTSLLNFPQPILDSTNLIKPVPSLSSSLVTSIPATPSRQSSSTAPSLPETILSSNDNDSITIMNENSNTNQSKTSVPWLTIALYSLGISCGTLLCILLSICAWIKYRRKDAGVYEVEEAQRFRPLIVQLSPMSGENTSTSLNAIETSSKKIKKKSKQKRKKSSNSTTDEQREFYI